MADARPFHWEYLAPPIQREAFRIAGGRPLSGVVPVSGVGGGTGLFAYVHPVTLYVGTAMRFHAITTDVAFTDPDVHLTVNVLGRTGFLDRIRLGVRQGIVPPCLYLGFTP